MNSARLIVLGIALFAGLGAFFIATSMNTPAPAPTVVVAEPEEVKLPEVLVASGDIGLGDRITSSTVSWQPWPESALNPNFIVRDNNPDAIEELSSSFARAAFLDGEPIQEGKLIQSDRGYMSAILPKGRRAVATEIDARTGAGGFILPNDRVDVIITHEIENPNSDNQHISETLLTNIRVLAIDQQVKEEDGESVVVGETATLELSARQAETLALAEEVGSLSLALRSVEDATTDGDEQLTEAGRALMGERNGSVTVIRYGVAQQVQGR